MRRMTRIMLAGTSILAGCTTLPTDKATGFQKAADADRDAYVSVAKIEESSIATRAQLMAAEKPGRYVWSGCDAPFGGSGPAAAAPTAVQPPGGGSAATLPPPPPPSCSVSFVPEGQAALMPRFAAPETRALIAAIAAYADKMSELATAKDVANAQTAVDGLSATISAIAVASGAGAPIAALIQFGDVATKEAFVAERRAKLLAAAQQAEPVIELAASRMEEISTTLQKNIKASAADRIQTELGLVVTEQDVLSCLRGVQPMPANSAFDERHCDAIRKATEIEHTTLERVARLRLSALNEDLFKAAGDFNDAAALKTDYQDMVKGHKALLATLSGKTFSPGAALADLNAVLSKLKPSK